MSTPKVARTMDLHLADYLGLRLFHYHSSFPGLLENAGQATNYAAVLIIAPLRCALGTLLSGSATIHEDVVS